MGNNSPRNQQSNEQSAQQHPHLGTLIATNNQLIKIESQADSYMVREQIERIKSRIKKYPQNPHLVRITHIESRLQSQMCVNNMQVRIYLQCYHKDLATVMREYQRNHQSFTEREIYQFLKQTVDSLVFMQDNGFKNIPLDERAILFVERDTDRRELKIIDTMLSSSTAASSVLAHDNVYLAPETLNELKQQYIEAYSSPKSDIFSLAMIVLSMLCMETMANYYDIKHFTIDYESLIHRISKLTYSLQLKTLLAQMLEYETEERIGLISLQQKINQYLVVPTLTITDRTERPRSTGSKMLKEILTQSRRSTSTLSRNHGKPSSSSSLSSVTKQEPQSSNKPVEVGNKIGAGKGKASHLPAWNAKSSKNYQEELKLRDIVKDKIRRRGKENEPKNTQPYKQSRISHKNSEELSNKSMQTQKQSRMSHKNSVFSEHQSNQNQSIQNHSIQHSGIQQQSLHKRSESNLKIDLSEMKLLKQKPIDSVRVNSLRNNQSQHSRLPSGRLELKSKQETKVFRMDDIIRKSIDETQSLKPAQTLAQPQPPRHSKSQLSQIQTFRKVPMRKLTIEIPEPPPTDNTLPNRSRVSIAQKAQTQTHNPCEISRESLGMTSIRKEFLEESSIDICTSQLPQFSSIPSQEQQQQSLSKLRYQDLVLERSSLFEEPKMEVKRVGTSIQPSFKKQKPVSKQIRVNKFRPSLEIMYKTTMSINNSDEKQEPQVFDYSKVIDIPNMKDVCPYGQKLNLSNGSYYEGEVNEDGQMEGNGIMFDIQQQIIYTGTWSEGNYHGFGTQYQRNPAQTLKGHNNMQNYEEAMRRFEGEYQMGVKHGFGTLYFPNGEKFSGCFQNGVIAGYGCFYRSDRQIISGLWENNRLSEK